jgi:hypothetical protein
VRVVDSWNQLPESVRMAQGKMPSSERPQANKTLREEDEKVNASEEDTK